ncbi:hypothetical protein BDZ85DRAFT_297244 [Elsinoe ampelina]|uniref:Uncharacterized protein n=1 Tax=Elsinoe ampelina TaxID=302913 RepID=A0A6A6G6T4_9PEZI|nr:hypothetical protein BDZ85DRAFT_297244 [Elsinoe ampelina]
MGVSEVSCFTPLAPGPPWAEGLLPDKTGIVGGASDIRTDSPDHLCTSCKNHQNALQAHRPQALIDFVAVYKDLDSCFWCNTEEESGKLVDTRPVFGMKLCLSCCVRWRDRSRLHLQIGVHIPSTYEFKCQHPNCKLADKKQAQKWYFPDDESEFAGKLLGLACYTSTRKSKPHQYNESITNALHPVSSQDITRENAGGYEVYCTINMGFLSTKQTELSRVWMIIGWASTRLMSMSTPPVLDLLVTRFFKERVQRGLTLLADLEDGEYPPKKKLKGGDLKRAVASERKGSKPTTTGDDDATNKITTDKVTTIAWGATTFGPPRRRLNDVVAETLNRIHRPAVTDNDREIDEDDMSTEERKEDSHPPARPVQTFLSFPSTLPGWADPIRSRLNQARTSSGREQEKYDTNLTSSTSTSPTDSVYSRQHQTKLSTADDDKRDEAVPSVESAQLGSTTLSTSASSPISPFWKQVSGANGHLLASVLEERTINLNYSLVHRRIESWRRVRVISRQWTGTSCVLTGAEVRKAAGTQNRNYQTTTTRHQSSRSNNGAEIEAVVHSSDCGGGREHGPDGRSTY